MSMEWWKRVPQSSSVAPTEAMLSETAVPLFEWVCIKTSGSHQARSVLSRFRDLGSDSRAGNDRKSAKAFAPAFAHRLKFDATKPDSILDTRRRTFAHRCRSVSTD